MDVICGYLRLSLVLPICIGQITPKFRRAARRGTDLTVIGSVSEVITQSHKYTRLIFYVDEAFLEKEAIRLPQKLMLSWYHRSNQSVSNDLFCNFTVRLKRHWRFANLGAVDIEKQMFLQGIGARGYVRKGQCAKTIQSADNKLGLRDKLIQEFAEVGVNLKYFSLMQALTFGVREHMDQSQWDILRITGTTHLLAISGLHLSAICFVVFVMTSRIARLSAFLCEAYPCSNRGGCRGYDCDACLCVPCRILGSYSTRVDYGICGVSCNSFASTSRAILVISNGFVAGVAMEPISRIVAQVFGCRFWQYFLYF